MAIKVTAAAATAATQNLLLFFALKIWLWAYMVSTQGQRILIAAAEWLFLNDLRYKCCVCVYYYNREKCTFNNSLPFFTVHTTPFIQKIRP